MPGPSAVYRFDPNLGDPRAAYRAVDFRQTHTHRPEIQARFVASVWGETVIRTLRGRQTMRWQAEPAIRIGVNTGDVVAGTWDASGRQDVAVTCGWYRLCS